MNVLYLQFKDRAKLADVFAQLAQLNTHAPSSLRWHVEVTLWTKLSPHNLRV